jgi:HAE1 family hydrophobic/amphiphilic exporter-1
MRKLAETCIQRPVFAAMLILALVVVGAASYARLSVDRLPSVDLPIVSVRVTLRGASPEEMETEIAQKLENAINTVEGIDELRSISGTGSCLVLATFKLNRDIDVAAQDIRDRVNNVLKDLPDDTDPPVIAKQDNDSDAVMTLALSGNRSIRELTEIADKIVRIQLERSPGVGSVYISGGLARAINIWINPDKLAAYQIPITAVQDAIARQNSDTAGGNVTTPGRENVLRTMGRFADAEAFNDLVVTTINGAPIRLRDIGWAEDGNKEQRSISRLNGVPTVTVSIQRQAKTNTVDVIEGAKASLARIADLLPPDVNIQVIRDQSRYIYASLHEINVHLILGSICASLVVLAFMRSLRSTIIAAVAIPASVISTFGMMAALGFTLNSVTMLALVLMVGVVIDDAIVVLENIFRFVEEKRMNAMQAAAAATGEIALAVLATTLSLVVIFIPVSFMSSISGRFLYQFGITAAVAVMVSLLVSFTLTPMMSSRLLRAADAVKGHAGEVARSRRGFYGAIDAGYTWLLKLSMRYRFVVALLGIATIATSVPLYRMVRQEFLPSNADEGEFSISVTGREGMGLMAMDSVLGEIEGELRATSGIQTILASSGSSFLGTLNSAQIHVGLQPHEQRTFSFGRLWQGLLRGEPSAAFKGNRSQIEVIQEVRRRLAAYRNVRIQVRNYASFNIGGGNFEIDFAIRGPSLDALSHYAEALRDMCGREVPGVVDADTTLKLDKPELRVQIDRKRAADLGVDASDIGNALRVMVGGEKQVSLFHDWSVNEDYDVDLRLAEGYRNDPATIANLYLPRRGGGLVQLGNLANVELVKSASRIDRVDRQRTCNLRAACAPGFALADRLDALRAAAASLNMPAGYTTRVAGRGRELERTFVEFVWAFVLSIIFMYMILASNYESLIHPFTILLSLPLAVPFALYSLYITGGTLNLYSALGILVLFGVVKKNAILQIDHMNNLRRQGMDRLSAIMQGNRDRLRPILMTTLALVAGMTPLAIGSGPGAEDRRAVAIVVIGGQSLSLLLTLLVTPVAYSIFDDIGALLRRLLVGRGRGHGIEDDVMLAPAEPGPVGPVAAGAPAESAN